MCAHFPGRAHEPGPQLRAGAPPLRHLPLIEEIEEDTPDPSKIVTRAPAERYRLRFLDVSCLVINRMIGTGIFDGPQTVIIGTNSTGVTLLFWFAGIFYCLAGAHVYFEYGRNVPRYVVEGVEQSVPRSGGDLNYLQYVYRKPRYKRETVLLIGCLFGISFICIGNMAGNCIICALRLLQAAHPQEPVGSFSSGQIRGIAIAIAFFACFIHAITRRGGIWLSNFLAIIKVGILLLIVGLACAVASGTVHKASDGSLVPSEFHNNTAMSVAFVAASREANGYAQAFLSIIFAFAGFDQANYVLGEISQPRKTFPAALFTGVGTVSVLYMAVNLCYMVVVPAASQVDLAQGSVAQQFFSMTFGVLSSNPELIGQRVFNVLLAISSFGSIVVTTYTAARMKQEIAKQGFLPWAKFFAQNRDISLGRLLRWLEQHGLKVKFLPWEHHSEPTPVGALVLHLCSCLVLIFASYNLHPEDAYDVLIGLIAYLTTACFGFLLALGILILRFHGAPRTDPVMADPNPLPGSVSVERQRKSIKTSWAALIKGSVKPWLSVTAATIYLIGNAYPIITNWVPPLSRFGQQTVAWYLVPLISWCVLGFASLWFLGFLTTAAVRRRRRNEEFVLQRDPDFDLADGSGRDDYDGGEGAGAGKKHPGGLVLVRETVYLSWRGASMDGLAELQEYRNDDAGANLQSMFHQPQRDNFAGTDFAGME